MALSRITARFGSVSPDVVVSKVYPGVALADAALFDFEQQVYLGFTGLKKPGPILALLTEDPGFEEFIQQNSAPKAVFLISAKGAFKNGEPLALSPEAKKAIRHGLRLIKPYGGVLNADGSHTIDLLSPNVGPHYGVNLLLGWREGFADPLLTTPKSVVDALGHGSFRAKADYQVLATRWDIRPEENGNPFNRQFYLLENGKQIFYSADLTHNVKKAFCTHFPNKTEIVYELKDGLQVKRVIALVEQKAGLPDATEVQNVTLLSPVARTLEIVFTG